MEIALDTDALMKAFFSLAKATHATNIPEFELVTEKTQNLMIVAHLVKQYRLKWNEIIQTLSKDVYVHPENAKQLLVRPDKDSEYLLAQGFVRPDKLIRVLKSAAAAHADVERLLAVDGLMGTLTDGPNFEVRHYLNNLKISTDSKRSIFDEEPDYRVNHVRAVRHIYSILKTGGITDVSGHVYGVLQNLLKKFTNLPGNGPEVSADVLDECRKAYESVMSEHDMFRVCQNLKLRNEKRSSEEESGEPCPKVFKKSEDVTDDE
jgi:hypothetical protein